MRLENFLNEDRSKKLEEDAIIKYIQKNCMKAFEMYDKRGIGMWRGHINLGTTFGIVSPRSHSRRSANTDNHYTLWIDNSKQWSKYPKRSQSLICGNRERAAYGSNYAKYLVLPKDGSDIGVCPESDFWDCFGRTYPDTIDAFNYSLKQAYKRMTDKDDAIDTSLSTLKRAVMDMDALWEYANEEQRAEWTDTRGITCKILDICMSKDFKNITKTIDYILDPQPNDFKLMKVGDTKIDNGYDQECWTDGDSVLIQQYFATDNMSREWKEFAKKVYNK